MSPTAWALFLKKQRGWCRSRGRTTIPNGVAPTFAKRSGCLAGSRKYNLPMDYDRQLTIFRRSTRRRLQSDATFSGRSSGLGLFAAKRSVFEAERLHCCRRKKIAAVHNQFTSHQISGAFPINLLVSIPFGADQRRVHAFQCLVRVLVIVGLRKLSFGLLERFRVASVHFGAFVE